MSDVGCVLAVDLGERRMGLAISDELLLTAGRLGVVSCVGPKRDARAVRDLLEGRKVRLLVVGLPVHARSEDEEGPAADLARERGGDLARRLELPVEFVDESRTTIEAAGTLREQGRSRRRRRELIDSESAVLILERWLASRPEDVDV